MISRWLILIVIGGIAAQGGIAHASSEKTLADARLKCDALKTFDFSGIQDAPTQVINAEFSGSADDSSAHCQVSGYVAPNVGFKLSLPMAWNGKFMHTGCAGFCGVAFESAPAACKHYACISSDMGHQGKVDDGLWAENNWQAKVDWGYRATHVATLAGKAITGRYYAQSPDRSYFVGCSTGGRQALREAQRFPWDFDGIIAASPALDNSEIFMEMAWLFRQTRDVNGNLLFDQKQMRWVTDAALEKCDLDDGVKDGIIGDPLHCAFDPAQLACKSGATDRCLTSTQITAVKKIYEGPVNGRGEKLTRGGPLPGSEANWADWVVGPDSGRAGQEFPINGFRHLFFPSDPGPSWSLTDFDFDRDYKRLGVMQALVDINDPDLRKFKAAGGKLIAFVGSNDGVFPRQAVDYYEAVERTLGGRKATQDFFRLFLAPGVNHCSGGVGADAVDLLNYLEAWVDRGEPPERLLSARFKEESPPVLVYPYRPLAGDHTPISFTRPIYPYPTRARYLGRGDPKDAKSFGPVVP